MKILKTKKMQHIKKELWKDIFNRSMPYNGIFKARGQRGEFQKSTSNFIREFQKSKGDFKRV